VSGEPTSSSHLPGDALRLPLHGAEIALYPAVDLGEPAELLARLLAEVPWRQESVTVYGKSHLQPRLIAWYGDPGTDYTYSGVHHAPLPWTPLLQQLRGAVRSRCDHTFNSVLLNCYRDGNDCMGLHADDEAELGPHPVIASLSLGAQRRMYFRSRCKPETPTYSVDLPDSSLLVMSGETQRNWKHGIRRTARPCGPRVNLTFRQIYPR